MKDIIIRKAVLADAEEIIKLNQYMWEITYKDIFSKQMFEDREKNIQQTIDKLKKTIVENKKINFVAEHNGKIVAQMSGNLKNFDDFDESIAQLGAMYILPEYQSTELSLSLAKKFAEILDKAQIKQMVTGCIAGNKFNGIHISMGGKLIKQVKRDNYESCVENFYIYNVAEILNLTLSKAIDNYRTYIKNR